MKKQSKERLFEVMGRLDKTFKPKLNEGFEEIEADTEEVPAEEPVIDMAPETGEEEPVEEKSVEEKYEELKEKVEELYGMINSEEGEEEPEGEEEMAAGMEAMPPEGEEVEAGEEEVELDELNEDHLKDRESQVKFICKNDKSCEKEDLKDLSDKEIKKKYNALEKKMGLHEEK